MMRRLLAVALFSATMIYAAQSWADENPILPVYPQSAQQMPDSFGAHEMMHCPDGYKLSFEGQEPTCVPMTAKELAGSLK